MPPMLHPRSTQANPLPMLPVLPMQPREVDTMKRLLASFALCALSGCVASYARTDIDSVSFSEVAVSINARGISMPVGVLAKAHIAPLNSDDNPMVGDVRSDDTTIMEVVRAPGEKNYAFLALRPGKTKVILLADGEQVGALEAVVTEQQ